MDMLSVRSLVEKELLALWGPQSQINLWYNEAALESN